MQDEICRLSLISSVFFIVDCEHSRKISDGNVLPSLSLDLSLLMREFVIIVKTPPKSPDINGPEKFCQASASLP